MNPQKVSRKHHPNYIYFKDADTDTSFSIGKSTILWYGLKKKIKTYNIMLKSFSNNPQQIN